MRSCDASDRQAHRLDAPEIVAGEVAVEQRLGDVDLAAPGGDQLLQRERKVLAQRDVPRDLKRAPIALHVRVLHAPQIDEQPLAGEQPLLEAVPVRELDERRRRIAALEAEGALGLLRGVERDLVGLEVDTRELADHPAVQLLVGVLVAQIGLHLLRVLHLQVVAAQFGGADLELQLRLRDPLLDLGLLLREQLHLVLPLFAAALILGLLGREVGLGLVLAHHLFETGRERARDVA